MASRKKAVFGCRSLGRRSQAILANAKSAVSELRQLRNIGKAMLKDFELLGIASIKQLTRCNADKLYARIQELTDSRHDPCVWDTYAAAIHQAKTGEALPWWEFTKVRKKRQAKRNPHPQVRGARS